MKKILSKIVAVLLVACFAFALTGCGSILGGLGGLGGSGTGGGKQDNTIQVQENVFEDATNHQPVYAGDVKSMMNEASERNGEPSVPKFENGVRIKIDGEYEATTNTQGNVSQILVVENFVMKTKKVNGKLTAEGSCTFKRYVTITGSGSYTEIANVNIYHDGTYLGLDMSCVRLINGGTEALAPDRSRQQLPVKNVGNFYGQTFIDDLFNYDMIAPQAQHVYDAVADFYDDQIVGTISRGSQYNTFMLEDVLTEPSDFQISFDSNYNILGYARQTRYGYCTVQQYFGNVNLPSDFNSWDIRQGS